MAQTPTIARKYAKGLYEACKPEELAEVQMALSSLASTISKNPSVLEAIKNPAISDPDKIAVLLTLLERLKQSVGAALKLLPNLMRVLVENKRALSIVEVAESFDQLVAYHFKMSQIEISSARPLDSDERNGYELTLKKQLGQQTTVSFSVDPELLGGIQIKAGDTLIDGSVRTSLQQLRNALLA